jgi:abortive infection bacteriophage resistance protein
MSIKDQKPILSTNQQIDRLKSNGVSFKLSTEEEAKNYLRYNNNYFKLTSYRKNFEKHQSGKKIGQYIDLDFAYLIDLAVIDMELRYIFVQLSLDIEHYIKMQLLRNVEDNSEDGYSICADFSDSLTEDQLSKLKREIERNKNNIYCGNLVTKYHSEFPIWAFLELIPFGRLVYFYGFCADRFGSAQMKDRFYALKTCNQLRNATAHSSCVINELKPGTARHFPRDKVYKRVSRIPGISKGVRKKKLSNARIQQIVTLLYVHLDCVTSNGIQRRSSKLLHGLSRRMFENIEFYKNNDLITSSFKFLSNIIDNWFPFA